MSVFSKIIGAGLAVNRAIRGESIIYRRGELAVPIFDAKLNATDLIVFHDMQAILQADAAEWRMGRASLVQFGKPRANDRIEWTNGGVTVEYLVSLPPELKKCWRWTDNGHTEFCVFCKLFGQG